MPDFKDVTRYLETDWEKKAVGFVRMHEDMAAKINELVKASFWTEDWLEDELKEIQEEWDLDAIYDDEDIERAVTRNVSAFIYGGYFASRWLFEQKVHEATGFNILRFMDMEHPDGEQTLWGKAPPPKPLRAVTVQFERGTHHDKFGWFIKSPGNYTPLPDEYWARRTIETARVDSLCCGNTIEWKERRDKGLPPAEPEPRVSNHMGGRTK